MLKCKSFPKTTLKFKNGLDATAFINQFMSKKYKFSGNGYPKNSNNKIGNLNL
jgi:hypothetical protein